MSEDCFPDYCPVMMDCILTVSQNKHCFLKLPLLGSKAGNRGKWYGGDLGAVADRLDRVVLRPLELLCRRNVKSLELWTGKPLTTTINRA